MSSRPDTLPAGSPPAEDSLIGSKVDKYELVRVIGRGGMGTVYEAVHTGIGKRVAIKFVDAELARNNDSVLRFQREAQAASAVESAHIVQIFDSGATEAGLPYLIMELLRGEDLGHRIKRCGRIDPPEAVQVTAQILRGLHRAHEAGIIHRDLKPDNIFLVDRDDDTSFVKILDFGISKVQRGQDVPVQTLTREGTVLGTPHYMSPEQAQALADVDNRADLWSTGAILYECLAGRPPHTGTTYEQVIVNICMKDAEDIRVHNPAVPEPLARVIVRALARERADRFASARDFLRAISVAAEAWVAPSRPGTPADAGAEGVAGAQPFATPGAPARTPMGAGSNRDDPSTFEPTLAVKSDAPSRVGWTTSRKKKSAVPNRRAFVVAGAVALVGAGLGGALYFRSQSGSARHGEDAGPTKDSHHEVSVQLRSNAAGARFLVQGIELPNGLLTGKQGETKKVQVIADGFVPAEQDVTLDQAKEPAAIVLNPAPPAEAATTQGAADPASNPQHPDVPTPPEAAGTAPSKRIAPPNRTGPNSPAPNGTGAAPPVKPTATQSPAPEPTTPATTPTGTSTAPQLKIKTE